MIYAVVKEEIGMDIKQEAEEYLNAIPDDIRAEPNQMIQCIENLLKELEAKDKLHAGYEKSMLRLEKDKQKLMNTVNDLTQKLKSRKAKLEATERKLAEAELVIVDVKSGVIDTDRGLLLDDRAIKVLKDYEANKG